MKTQPAIKSGPKSEMLKGHRTVGWVGIRQQLFHRSCRMLTHAVAGSVSARGAGYGGRECCPEVDSNLRCRTLQMRSLSPRLAKPASNSFLVWVFTCSVRLPWQPPTVTPTGCLDQTPAELLQEPRTDLMTMLVQDFRYALRQIRRAPGFAWSRFSPWRFPWASPALFSL